MTKHEEETQEDVVDTFEENPEDLRDNDEIDDKEEAFMEGYDKDAEEEEEEEEELEDEFK